MRSKSNFAALAFLLACGGDGGGSTAVTSSVATVVVSPASTSLVIGGMATFTALARDGKGATVAGHAVTWATQNSAVLTINTSGVATAVGPGTASVTATVDGVSGAASVTVGARSVATVQVTPKPMLVAVGGTATVHAEALDQQGTVFSGQSFTYQSSAPALATVDANGVVKGLGAGQVTISATAAGVSGSSQAFVLAPTPLTRRLVAADGGQTQALQFELQTGSGASLQAFDAPVDPTGAFRLDAPLTLVPTDSVALVVDATGTNRVYRPVVARTSSNRAASMASRPLLVPRRITFATPAYPSATIDVSLQSAFARVCTDDANANCNSFFPQIWKSSVILWADADLPVPLAFNRATGAISATDSIAMWGVIDQMQRELGRQLFVPTDFSQVLAPDANGFSRKAVLVSVDATLSGFSGFTNWIWDGAFNMLASKTRVRLNSFLADRSLMTHELLHALGFHHTCAWVTVMGGYGCTSAAGATQADVAAFTLGYQIRRAIIATPPTTTLADALRGEQVRELGLAADRSGLLGAVSFAPVAARQVWFGGRWVFADGAP